MFPQVAALAENLVTQRTLVWFLSRVNSHVKFQTYTVVKRSVANVTLIQSLSTVYVSVCKQMSMLRKSFATNGAFEWFLSGMSSPVISQRTAVSKPLPTFAAFVLLGVPFHMQLQVNRIRKMLLAPAARIQHHSGV